MRFLGGLEMTSNSGVQSNLAKPQPDCDVKFWLRMRAILFLCGDTVVGFVRSFST